jgi:hypothetical protein
MKKFLLAVFLITGFSTSAQTVFGYWYGTANVKINGSASNYMIELVLQPEKNFVKGVMNYYFKDSYRSLQVKGNYDAPNRRLSLYNIPLTYFGSVSNFQIDCIMNMQATLRVAQAGSNLTGSFFSLPDYQYTCLEVGFNLAKNADASKTDSVLKAISEFKETMQVWKPQPEDTAIALNVTPPPNKIINYPTEKEFTERENVLVNEIEVESDTVRIGIYDNGEIDGDIISIFYNQKLILYSQKLTHKSIRIKLPVDSLLKYNEISMFAENLGLIPPNTALMVIEDGKNTYELRLSSSLEKNATVRLKKKQTGVGAKEQ